jgi:hypothetical protein
MLTNRNIILILLNNNLNKGDIMKKYFYLIVLVILGLTFAACDESTTEPEAVTTGSVYITSTPAGAAIWMGTTNQGKVTPDSLTGLEAGNYQVTLKLTGYKDTTFTVTITARQKTTKSVTLTTDLSTQTFGPVKLYETYNTSATQPSGLVLATGAQVSSSASTTDLYYYTNSTFSTHEIRSSSTRSTFFKVWTAATLLDGIDSPTKDANWATIMSDTETNYAFIYDADHHYSKLIITSVSSILETPAYINVQYIYNKTVDDKRF